MLEYISLVKEKIMHEVEGKWEHDPFWGGFAEFVDQNFKVSLETVLEELEDANRFQKGTESIADLLINRGPLGQAVLRIIELYIQQFRNEKADQTAGIDIYAPHSAGHLQTFSEATAHLPRKRYLRDKK